MGLAVFIGDGDPLLPFEQVAKGLLCSGKGAADNRVRRFMTSHGIRHVGQGDRRWTAGGIWNKVREGKAGERQQWRTINFGRKAGEQWRLLCVVLGHSERKTCDVMSRDEQG